jgi:DNA-binding transcriptional LysR family regulator
MKHIFRPEITIFQQIIKSQSMSAAAEVLNVHQPAISKALKRLERDLGSSLISRGRDGVRATKEGQALLSSLELWSEKQLRLDPLKSLTIACHQSLAMEIFPQFIPALRDKLPQTEMKFIFQPSLEVTHLVSLGKADFGLVINPVKKNQMIVRPLYKEAVHLWGEKKHPEVLIHPDMLYALRVEKQLDETVLEVPDYEVIALMIKQGYRGVLPEKVADRHGLSGRGKKLFEVQLSLICHEDRFDRSTLKLLQDCLKN